MMNTLTLIPEAYNSTEERLQAILREVADFNAIYEALQEKLKAREQALEQKAGLANQQLMHQLREIQHSLEIFANFMTEEGAARGRIAVKQAREEVQANLQALKESCQNMQEIVKGTQVSLDRTVNQTLTHVTEITQSFPAAEFKQVAQQSCNDIKNASAAAIRQISGFVKLFHRKNLLMAFMLTLFMAFILGLYLNGEWPWEIHQDVIKERTAGRALLAAWPKLSPAEQQTIINAAKRNPVI